MRLNSRSVSRILSAAGIAGLIVAAVPAIAAAAPIGSGGNYTCTGTSAAPGTLAGDFANVTIAGTCLVDAGNVRIAGNLTVAPNASLVADFGMNDQTDSGTSNVSVGGNMVVEKDASVLFGCYPLLVTLWFAPPPALGTTPDFPCDDDATAFTTGATLAATETIGGNLLSYDPAGTVVHNTTVRGNVVQVGGGGPDGLNFVPIGIFAQYIPGGPPAAPGQLDAPIALPAYSDYANVRVGGNMSVTGMVTNWYGIVRNTVGGSLIDSGNTASPDANEAINNVVYGNMVCTGNNPAVEYGDSNGGPNKVGGNAVGECGFSVLIQNPSPTSVPGLSTYPEEHISVRLH